VLASGLPWEWISQEQGFSVRGLMTRFGRLEFQMDVPETLCIRFEIGASLTLPNGGLHVAPPMPPGKRIRHAICSEGHPLTIEEHGTSVTVNHLPISATLFLDSTDLTA
ncbi:hypothetical protein HQ447_14340, partial [bacterium]|nr:hypothetical protein [bacterium]